ncbi:hypothetical protein [Shouchella miscanthi]|uniref:Phr family secreted Rap phosphatase inhibitor n=1 Tax=Shouchella miscanthi TaxID=2598861 RepID=A0ABU6NJ08_9BACI|nr:hypothetical protein [Shouchella miscanthi]
MKKWSYALLATAIITIITINSPGGKGDVEQAGGGKGDVEKAPTSIIV